jgi:hypothetical protein
LPLSVAALVIAATGLTAFIEYLAAQTPDAGPGHQSWSAVAVLRILVAPLFAGAFFLSGLFAPSRSSRIALFVATLIETGVFACVALRWFHPFLSH